MMAQLPFRIPALCLFLLLAWTSCQDNERGEPMIYTEFFIIQSGANVLDTHYFQSAVRSVEWSQFLGSEVSPEDVRRITPSFARIRNDDGIPLDFIQQAIIQVFPDEDIQANPALLEVAFRNNVPNNTNTELELIPSIPDFLEEFSDDQFIYRVGLRYRRTPPTDVRIVLDFGFEAFLE